MIIRFVTEPQRTKQTDIKQGAGPLLRLSDALPDVVRRGGQEINPFDKYAKSAAVENRRL